MMQLYGALILFMTLSTGLYGRFLTELNCVAPQIHLDLFPAACGLRCYTCTAADPKSCTDTKSCAVLFNRCFSLKVDGYNMVSKGCQTSMLCVGAMACCEGDLCNSATPSIPNVILLLVSSAIIIHFL